MDGITYQKNKDGSFSLFSIISAANLLNKEIQKGNIRIESKITSEIRKVKEAENEESFKKIHFTWQDIIFTNEGLKIDPNIIFLSIDIEGPTEILNEIKESYFLKKYSKKLYKVYVSEQTLRVNYEKSTDLLKIKEIVLSHINNSTKKPRIINSTNQKVETKLRSEYNESKQIGIKDIEKEFPNNIFY